MSGAVLVTGGRDYLDEAHVFGVLDALAPNHVLHGDAPGVDAAAARWCLDRDVAATAMAARWDLHGRAAGPIRNGHLVALAVKLDAAVHAFPGGRGTADCVRRARAAGLSVTRHGTL